MAPSHSAVLLSLIYTLALLFALWLGATVLLQAIHLTGLGWLDHVLGALGSLAALFLAWVLFPAMSAVVLSFFLNGVAAAVERRHYPGLPPPRRQPPGELIAVSLRLGLLAIVVNLVALPMPTTSKVSVVMRFSRLVP